MSRVLITGSADGLGREAAKQLARAGHDVVLHARDEARARQALAAVPGAAAALPGDLSSISEHRALADLMNVAGVFDAIIHNAGIGYREPTRRETEDGLEHVFQTNVLAPYLLTALAHRPARLIYLSSGLHRSGDPDLADLQWEDRRWDGPGVLRLQAVRRRARRRGRPPVAGRHQQLRRPRLGEDEMGGRGRPARSAPAPRRRSGSRPVTTRSPCEAVAISTIEHCAETHPAVADPTVQDGLLAACYELTGEAITGPTGPAHARLSRDLRA